MIQLKDASRLMIERANSGNLLETDSELVEYVSDIQLAGAEILKSVSQEEMMAAISLVQGAVAADLLEDGEIRLFMAMMSNPELFGGMMMISMKMAVGLAEVEGWIK